MRPFHSGFHRSFQEVTGVDALRLVVDDGDRIDRHAIAAEFGDIDQMSILRNRRGRRLSDAVLHRLPAFENVQIDDVEARTAAFGIGAGAALRRAAEHEPNLAAKFVDERLFAIFPHELLLHAAPDADNQLVARLRIGDCTTDKEIRRCNVAPRASRPKVRREMVFCRMIDRF